MTQNNEQAGGDEQLFSQELGDWATFALDAAVEFYTDGTSTPFLLVLDQDDKKHLVNLELTVDASVEELLHVARTQFREMFPAAVLYSLVWDAELNIEGESHNGILAECGQQDKPTAWLFAQLYEGDVAEDTFDAKEEPVVIGPVDSAFEDI